MARKIKIDWESAGKTAALTAAGLLAVKAYQAFTKPRGLTQYLAIPDDDTTTAPATVIMPARLAEVLPLSLGEARFSEKAKRDLAAIAPFTLDGARVLFSSPLKDAASVASLLERGVTSIDARELAAAGETTVPVARTHANMYYYDFSQAANFTTPTGSRDVTKVKADVLAFLNARGTALGHNPSNPFASAFLLKTFENQSDATYLNALNEVLTYAKTTAGTPDVGLHFGSPLAAPARWASVKANLSVINYRLAFTNKQGVFGNDTWVHRQKNAGWLYELLTQLKAVLAGAEGRPVITIIQDTFAGLNDASEAAYIRPDMAESTPIWLAMTGAFAAGGGVEIWKDLATLGFSQDWYAGIETAFLAGLYRVSRVWPILKNCTAADAHAIEFSLDGGTTWQTDARTEADAETSEQPYVRAMVKENRIVIAAYLPLLEYGSKPVKIRYANWSDEIVIRARQTYLASAYLPV